jgi:hypothetical protein
LAKRSPNVSPHYVGLLATHFSIFLSPEDTDHSHWRGARFKKTGSIYGNLFEIFFPIESREIYRHMDAQNVFLPDSDTTPNIVLGHRACLISDFGSIRHQRSRRISRPFPLFTELLGMRDQLNVSQVDDSGKRLLHYAVVVQSTTVEVLLNRCEFHKFPEQGDQQQFHD